MANSIGMYPDKSHLNINGQSYEYIHCEAVDGLYQNPTEKGLFLISEYVFQSSRELLEERIKIANSYFQEQKGPESTEDEISDLEGEGLDDIRSNPRMKGVIYPSWFEKRDEQGTVKVYTVCDVSNEFGKKYRQLKKAIFSPMFAMPVRLKALSNILNLLQTLNEKFHQYFQKVDMDSMFVDIETGEVQLLLEKMIAAQNDVTENTVNSDLAFIIFEMICGANPYDGKKTLVEFPLLTPKTEKMIKDVQKEFIFGKDNRVSKYIGQGVITRWNAIPQSVRYALEDNLDVSRAAKTITYNMEDWIYSVRTARDLLVLSRNGFGFCNPKEENPFLFLRVENEYWIPICPRKAVYGYHVGETDYPVQEQAVLGMSPDGKIINCTEKDIIVELQGNRKAFPPKNMVEARVGMKFIVNDHCTIEVVK